MLVSGHFNPNPTISFSPILVILEYSKELNVIATPLPKFGRFPNTVSLTPEPLSYVTKVFPPLSIVVVVNKRLFAKVFSHEVKSSYF